MKIIKWSFGIVLGLAVVLLVVQAVRVPSTASILTAINTARASYGLRLLRTNPYLQEWAQIRARGLAQSRDTHQMTSFPPLNPAYQALRYHEILLNTDEIPSRFFGVTGEDVAAHLLKYNDVPANSDVTARGAILDGRYHDIGIGIAPETNGYVVFIVVAQQVDDPI